MQIYLMAALIAMLTSLPIVLAQAEVRPDHAKRMARGLAIFQDGVSQALKQRCVKCHGGDKIRGELDITTHDLLLEGGSKGPAVVPGSAKTSRLFRLISHVEKPHLQPAVSNFREIAVLHSRCGVLGGCGISLTSDRHSLLIPVRRVQHGVGLRKRLDGAGQAAGVAGQPILVQPEADCRRPPMPPVPFL